MRFLSLVLALPLSVSALPDVGQKISTPRVEPCAPTKIHMVSYGSDAMIPRDVPWIAALPKSSQIVGFLFYVRPHATGDGAAMRTHGTMPDGGNTKILWIVKTHSIHRTLTIAGKNLTGEGTMHQSVRASSGGYPSIIDIPVPGCWQLTLRNGEIKGKVTLRVID